MGYPLIQGVFGTGQSLNSIMYSNNAYVNHNNYMRNLINNNGTPFQSTEIKSLRIELDALDNDKRTEYRNQNATAIAEHAGVKFLIVSGPGTGKSHLFLNRINHWYEGDSEAKVLVTSFVRKLVADLQNDIDGDTKLSNEQKKNITASTLHKLARGIVETNHGTANWKFSPHFRIIGQYWKDIIWQDVLLFHPTLNITEYSWKSFESQLHNADFSESSEWQSIRETYFRVCKFLNAAGFADLILRAKEALVENPTINETSYFIFDEYQDFNNSENELINQLASDPKGLLIVGDDEQVLYETLKSGKPTLIRDIYKNTEYANGMLPFCGRSSFHITKTAGHFIQQNTEADCIEKIYLPIKVEDGSPKVQIVGCATSSTAVDYIEKFVADNKSAIDERKVKLETGEEKDAFLLILTPAKKLDFYGQLKEKIFSIVKEYQAENTRFTEDYYKLLTYYSLANNSNNNFTFRKVLFYENVPVSQVHDLIEKAIQNEQGFCDLEDKIILTTTQKCNEIKRILEEEEVSTEEKVKNISKYISIADLIKLQEDINQKSISDEEVTRIEHQEEEQAELEEIEVKKMGAVELMTIVGSKGLSAEHVIIVGFDNVNMNWVTKNAFYVAMTRARKSLHILTALKSGGATQSHKFLDQMPDTNVECYSYKKTGHVKFLFSNKQDFKDYLSRLNSASKRR